MILTFLMVHNRCRRMPDTTDFANLNFPVNRTLVVVGVNQPLVRQLTPSHRSASHEGKSAVTPPI